MSYVWVERFQPVNTSSVNSNKSKGKGKGKGKVIHFNEGSTESAYLAAGSVLEAADKVAKGELNSAFAIVRPPGHHAEKTKPMGFCLFNNVAIASLQQVIYLIKKHEYGSFYPIGDDGSHIMVGEDDAAGYNINVPWVNGHCGDADYISVWDNILIPVAREFKPDVVVVSAGFDAALGDPLGGCRITPDGYSIMLKKLLEFSNGKIIMALEGGYNLDSLANSVLACVEVLLEGKPIAEPFRSLSI